MASLFDGTDCIIRQFLGFERKRLNNKVTRIRSISDKEYLDFIDEMYSIMDNNYRQIGYKPESSSSLWRCRHEVYIRNDNSSKEKILEKSVAILAKKDHMPEWFNQCPVASGITDPSADSKRAVDLVQWCELTKCVRLIELKWESNTPPYALFEILEYGLAYIFCRVHREKLPIQAPLMNARHVALEVAAPHSFYTKYFEDNECHRFQDMVERGNKSLNKFVESKISDLSMSLDALAFPEGFRLPFRNGRDVKQKCRTHRLTEEGKYICDAFANLTSVWPEP